MSKISFITEKRVRELIASEVERNKEKGHIVSPGAFSQHCINTGRIGYEVAKKIIENHPSLAAQINPDVIKTQGYMHDFSKIYEGQKYHEIGTAFLVLTKGDTELELLCGGEQSERNYLLKEIASLIPPDYALFDELGGKNFPDAALYPDKIGDFMERLDFLRRVLSKTDSKLSIEEFALPLTIGQQIALYADLTNADGKRVSVQERMTELQVRYKDPKRGYNNPVYAEVTDIIRPRIIVVANTIENLLK